MASLRVVRKSEYNNRLRKFKIYIDNNRIGEISDGEEVTYEIPEGRHVVNLKMDWCESPERSFQIAQNEVRTFYVSGFKHGGKLNVIIAVLLAAHFILSYTDTFDYVLLFSIPFLFYSLYFLTFGRKKYLQLTDEFRP